MHLSFTKANLDFKRSTFIKYELVK